MISCSAAFLTLPFAGTAFDLVLDAAVVFVTFLTVAGLTFEAFGGSSKSLRSVTVAGVQVDVDVMLARIESAVTCKEAMMI